MAHHVDAKDMTEDPEKTSPGEMKRTWMFAMMSPDLPHLNCEDVPTMGDGP